MQQKIHVVAGALADWDGRILIAKRPEKVHQGGRWEFPGGKLDPGETPLQALSRELEEELGIQVGDARALIRVHHDYGDRHILLDVYRVTAYRGEPHGREGQPLDWVHPDAMDASGFPAADRPIITALRLPDTYLITGADPLDSTRFLSRLERALDAGVRLVQLRAHTLSAQAFVRLAEAAAELCRAHGARLLANCDPALLADLPVDGLHLTASRLRALEHRPMGPDKFVAASCHNASELAKAAALRLDFAVLSPVQLTPSHADATPLGWPGFAKLVEPVALPIYALGGLGPDDLELAQTQGAQGIAGISSLWPA